MTRRVLPIAIATTLGVILGFGILIVSEQRTAALYRTEIARAAATPGFASPDAARVAELRAEVARLEAALARCRTASGPAAPAETTVQALPPRTESLPSPARAAPLTLAPPDDAAERRDAPGSGAAGSLSHADTRFLPAPPGFDRNAMIEGRVLADPTGEPLAEFTVGVRKQGGDWVRKDLRECDGRFHWTLDPGRADVFVYAAGYGEWQGRQLELLAATVARLTVRLVPEGRLEGHVLDADTGEPVAGAVLSLPDEKQKRSRWKATTGVDGWFSGASPFVDGTARPVKVMHDQYVTLLTAVPARGEVTLRLRRGSATLLGLVKTADGQPISDASIRVIKDDAERPEVKTVATDVEGRFRVSGLTPGRFLVWASARHFPGAVRVVSLSPGESDVTEFAFRAGLALVGRVVRVEGRDTPLLLRAYDASGGFLMEVGVSRDGRFRLENLAPGEYTLKVYEKDSAAPLKTYPIRIPIADGEVTLVV